MIENDTNYTNTVVPKTAPVSAEAAAKATQQEDDEYKSDRHDLSPVCRSEPNVASLRSDLNSRSSHGPTRFLNYLSPSLI